VLANLRMKLEKQVAELVEINETFVKKNAELAEQVAKLTDKVAPTPHKVVKSCRIQSLHLLSLDR
jgi:hypothetical protein